MAEGDYLISAVVTQPYYDEEGAYYYDEKPVDSAGLEELWSAVQADLADGSLGRRYLLENQARLENCYVNDLILTFRRRARPPAPTAATPTPSPSPSRPPAPAPWPPWSSTASTWTACSPRHRPS